MVRVRVTVRVWVRVRVKVDLGLGLGLGLGSAFHAAPHYIRTLEVSHHSWVSPKMGCLEYTN